MTAAFVGLGQLRERNAGQVFLNQRMRGRFADKQEVAARGAHRLAQWLAGEQVIAQVDRVPPLRAAAMGGQPAAGRCGFTVLFVMTILRRDELRRQRQDHVVSRGDQRGGHHGMEGFARPIAAHPRRTTLAVDGVGTERLGAVEGNQHMTAQTPEPVQALVTVQFAEHRREDRMQARRGHRVQQVANMVVARDLCHPEQRLSIRTPVSVLQLPLIRQNRRALHEKQRKRGQPDIGHGIAGVRAAPLVRKGRTALGQRVDHPLQRFHLPVESQEPAFGKRRGRPESLGRIRTAHRHRVAPSVHTNRVSPKARPDASHSH